MEIFDLLNKKYILNSSGIFSIENYESIKYSDGDESENYIDKVFSNTKNLNSNSDQLTKYIIDWPSRYHLSKQRLNLLYPFIDKINNKKVLEIGSGFGAITRFLGEKANEVLSLEGSLRRATTQKKRLIGLNNVNVLVENFENFDIDFKFDLVVSIGVLEYANMFFHEENSHKKFLEKINHHLIDDGVLMLAIENRLGLKYFSGGFEDHVSQPMVGIENTYPKKGPMTFGKKELTELLNSCGFEFIDYYYPFPDYKLPNLILDEKTINSHEIDIRALIQRSYTNDFLLPDIYTFDRFNALHSIIKNDLNDQFANSFFVIANKQNINTKKSNNIFIFANSPYEKYIKNQIINLKNNNYAIETLDSEGRSTTRPYIQGNLFLLELFEIVKKDKWSITELLSFWEKYISLLRKELNDKLVIDPEKKIHGKFLEFVPSNILILNDGETVYIDQEVESFNEISLGYLLFRAQLYSYNAVVTWRNCIDLEINNLLDLISIIHKSIFNLNYVKIEEYCYIEDELQLKKGYDGEIFKFICSNNIVSRHYTDIIRAYTEKIQNLEQKLFGIENSISWKLTSIIRKLKKLFKL